MAKNTEPFDFESYAKTKNYISCIKIHGVPILPPVLNDTRRAEMRYYRDLAVKREHQIKSKLRRRYSESTEDGRSVTYTNTDHSSTCSTFDDYSSDKSLDGHTSKSPMSFNDSCKYDVLNMLKDKQKGAKLSDVKHIVPSSDVESKRFKSKKEYKEFLAVQSDKALAKLTNLRTVSTKGKNNTTESSDENYITANETTCKEDGKIKAKNISPKLIRSNSYTLDSPSPMLLAYMKQEKRANIEKEKSAANGRIRRKTWNTASQKDLHKIVNDEAAKLKNKTNSSVWTAVTLKDDIKKKNGQMTEKKTIEKKILVQEKKTALERKTPEKKLIPEKKVRSEKKTTTQEIAERKWTQEKNVPPEKKIVQEIKMMVEKTITPESKPIPERKVAPLQKMTVVSNYKIVTSKSISPKSRIVITPKRKSWDLASAKYKWSSIENDLPECPNLIPDNTTTKKFSSLPPSPNLKMFNTSIQSTLKHQKSYTDENEKVNIIQPIVTMAITPTLHKFTQPKPDTPNFQRCPVKGFVTPSRNTSQANSNSDKLLCKDNILRKVKSDLKNKPPNPTPKIIKTDISMINPKIVTPKINENKDGGDSEISIVNNTKSSPISPEVHEILKIMQENQKKEMDELIIKQKLEQERCLIKFAEQQSQIMNKIKEVYAQQTSVINNTMTKGDNLLIDTDLLNNSENILFTCKKLLTSDYNPSESPEEANTSSFTFQNVSTSQTLQFNSLNSSLDTLNDPELTIRTETAHEHEVKYRQTSPNNVQYKGKIVQYNRSMSDDSLEPTISTTIYAAKSNISRWTERGDIDNENLPKRYSQCCRALFQNQKENWAASKICAVVRGFLVRRLIRTERIQNLIHTIKDTLLCAVDIQESGEKIAQCDIDLHNRLIQQVSAACIQFNEIFFNYSVQQQMLIISMDRQRLKEKLLRPTSGNPSTFLTKVTQRVIQRKLERATNPDSTPSSARSSFSRSCHSKLPAAEFRQRAKSAGTTDSVQYKKSPPSQEGTMHRSVNYGATKKPWR